MYKSIRTKLDRGETIILDSGHRFLGLPRDVQFLE